MKVLGRQILSGPNLHAPKRVIRLTLDGDACRDWPGSGDAVRATAALTEVVPSLDQSSGEAESPVARLRRDEKTCLGAVVAQAALGLQVMAGARATIAIARPGRESCDVIFGYDVDEVGVVAGDFAVSLVQRLTMPERGVRGAPDSDIDPIKARDSFLAFARRFALHATNAALVDEAERRNIPWFEVAPGFGFVQFGQGARQKRISGSSTSALGSIGFHLAANKSLHNQLFRRLGLPVPEQRVVTTAAAAARAAERLGYPVVVKPNGAGKGEGVTVGLVDAKGVELAFSRARAFDRMVIVERFVAGEDHRLLVVGGKLLAASKRIPAHVIGDGISTIDELVEAENRSPRRGTNPVKQIGRIPRDEQMISLLAETGRSLQSVPAMEEVVFVYPTPSVSLGGSPVDVTRSVHPDNRRMAERAAMAAGLDVAGVDFLTRDITRSHKDVGGAICEINTWPGLAVHRMAEGSPDVVRGIMEFVHPPGTDGRIPTAAITGTNGKTTTSWMLAHILRCDGRRVGICSTQGVHVDGREIIKGDLAGFAGARMILADPLVDAAVLETARGGIIKFGLGFDRCDVAAVTNLTDDHVGIDGVDSLEQMAEVKGLVAAAARESLVLNAEDEWSGYFARRSTAKRIVLVALDGHHPRLRAHVAAGGAAAFCAPHGGRPTISLHDDRGTIPVMAIDALPASFGGKADYNVANALFAAAIARAMGADVGAISRGLAESECDLRSLPGRTLIHDRLPFHVIQDYGHNPASMAALRHLIDRLEPRGRRIVVIQLPGNRRDGHFAAVCGELAGAFDHYICYQSDKRRGRADGELPRMLQAGLLAHGTPAERIELIFDQRQAIDAGLRMARPGDLVLVLVDNAIERCWRQIQDFKPTGAIAAPLPEPRMAR